MKCCCRNFFYAMSLMSLCGCVTSLSHVESGIGQKQLIQNQRYSHDRTFLLSDIAPVVDAYVELPFPVCNLVELQQQAAVGHVHADLSKSREQRVYEYGEVKCIL